MVPTRALARGPVAGAVDGDRATVELWRLLGGER
jgi:hypothetical protein